MILSLLGQENIVAGITSILLVFGVLVWVIAVHEFAHAWVAYKLGDPTAKALGRVTLNPFAHLDPIGTLLILFVGFGWGKPVPFNPNNFANPRRDSALVSLAGPVSNLIFAIIFAMLYKVAGETLYGTVLLLLVRINLVLCFFNLIPIHPLDGFKVVWGMLPPYQAEEWMRLAPYGMYFLLILILTDITDILVSVPVSVVMSILLG